MKAGRVPATRGATGSEATAWWRGSRANWTRGGFRRFRATKQFERLYKGRTAVERVNGRFKLYWGADDGNVVGARRFHAMVCVVTLVHLALGTVLAGKGRGTIKTLGGTRLSPIAQALHEQIERERSSAHEG